MYICMHIYIYVCMCVICVCVYIYIYTQSGVHIYALLHTNPFVCFGVLVFKNVNFCSQNLPPHEDYPLIPFFFLILFIYLFIAVLGLCFCARAFSSCGKWGPLLIAVRGPLTIPASLVVERRLRNCGSRA